jgi:hypothetical protein
VSAIYSDDQWRAVLDVPLPPRVNTDRRTAGARAKLERIAGEYRKMEAARSRWPDRQELERRHEAVESVLKLPVSAATRAELKARDWASETGYAMLRKQYSRTGNPTRKLLYGRLLDFWTQMGGRLSRSRTREGQPGGPLIRFLEAALRPVLGDKTPKPEWLVTMIKAEKKRLASVRAKASPIYSGFDKKHRRAPAKWTKRK